MKKSIKIIVTSDTHGAEQALQKLILQNQSATTLIHLGDGAAEFFKLQNQFKTLNMIIVRGNCDFNYFNNLPTERIIQINEHLKIFACHGHTFNVKQNPMALIHAAQKNNANLALFGHTHNRFLTTTNGLTILNPGSLAKPRDFNPSFAKITIFDDNNFQTEICEF